MKKQLSDLNIAIRFYSFVNDIPLSFIIKYAKLFEKNKDRHYLAENKSINDLTDYQKKRLCYLFNTEDLNVIPKNSFEKVLMYKIQNGLTIPKFAKLLGVDLKLLKVTFAYDFFFVPKNIAIKLSKLLNIDLKEFNTTTMYGKKLMRAFPVLSSDLIEQRITTREQIEERKIKGVVE